MSLRYNGLSNLSNADLYQSWHQLNKSFAKLTFIYYTSSLWLSSEALITSLVGYCAVLTPHCIKICWNKCKMGILLLNMFLTKILEVYLSLINFISKYVFPLQICILLAIYLLGMKLSKIFLIYSNYFYYNN